MKLLENIKLNKMLRTAYKDYKRAYPNGNYENFNNWLDGDI